MTEIRDDYERELTEAIKAARAAGRLIAESVGEIRERDVRLKGMNDLVTEVDEAAEMVIIESLSAAFPEHRFLAEESADGFEDDGSSGSLRWIIDPIDGTTNFTRGLPPYAVSIGLERRGEVVVGVVLEVSRGELFTAIKGGGLYFNGERHHVSRTERLGDSLLTTGFPYRAVGHIDLYMDVLGEFMRRSRGVRRPGSAAVDLAYVACGRFDGFFETGLKAWDVAAGTLLVEEGGGRVTDYRERANPLFAEQILATNGRIHAEMLAVLDTMKEVYQ